MSSVSRVLLRRRLGGGPPAEEDQPQPVPAIQIEDANDPEDNQAANDPEDNQAEEDQPQPVAAIQIDANDPEDNPAEEEADPDAGKIPIGFTPLQRYIWQKIVDQIDEERQEMERNRRHCRGHEYLLSKLDKNLAELENIRNTFSITPVRDPQILDDNGIPVGLSPFFKEWTNDINFPR